MKIASWLFFGVALSTRISTIWVFITASPARTAWKNPPRRNFRQSTSYFGDWTLVDMNLERLSFTQLNTLDRAGFVSHVGWVYEHSAWVAERAWEHRPFTTIDGLHAAMDKVVEVATPGEKMSLIQAHPDLAGGLARQGKLTAASTSEQATAGLNELTPEDAQAITKNNRRYREKFGFPFIVCVRLNNIELIREAFKERLQNGRAQEINVALGEISKIARQRLADVVA
jgi:2-oxo-4-hydroxy-4-carboxy-5-ureidoimidazoline decarboxylase